MKDKKPEIFIVPEQRRNAVNKRVAVETVAHDLRMADRRIDDRRGLHLNVGLSSDDTMTKIITWLIKHCSGEWYIGTGDDVHDGDDPVCRVKFDAVDDLKKFQEWLIRDEGAVVYS